LLTAAAKFLAGERGTSVGDGGVGKKILAPTPPGQGYSRKEKIEVGVVIRKKR